MDSRMERPKTRRAWAGLVLGGLACAGGPGCRSTGMLMGRSPAEAPPGSISERFEIPIEEVEPAVEQAMNDLAMTVKPGPRAEQGGVVRVLGRAGDDRIVRVDLAIRGESTGVTVAVGRHGDEPLSLALLERVGVRLGTREPAPIPESAPSRPAGNPFLRRDAVPDSVMLRDQVRSNYAEVPAP